MNERAVTMEQAEHLSRTARCSFADAREALEATNGELLDALIWLEQQGRADAAAATFSTKNPQAEAEPVTAPIPRITEEMTQRPTREQRRNLAHLIKRWLIDNRLEAYQRKSGREFQIPIGVALALLLMSFWLVPILLIVGYVFGWRYRLAGPDLSREDVNQVMENINDTADDVVSSVRQNFHS